MDTDASAGDWSLGTGTFAPIGGDGRHGDFSLELLTPTGEVDGDGRSIYVLDTDNTVIPATQSTTGAIVTVTDGRFFFATMTVPADARVRFAGTAAPVFTVAGRVQIDGVIENNGSSLTSLPPPVSLLGQPGAAGGVFGGKGGDGGDRSPGLASQLEAIATYRGKDGEAARVPAGHAYLATAASTAGRGSDVFPASALSVDLLFPTNPPAGLMYAFSACAGGSGGGLWQSGEDGLVGSIQQGGAPFPNQSMFKGPDALGGSALQLFPFPAASTQRSSLHFLVGGAGGGGAASNGAITLNVLRRWAPGGGGAGGAGPIALRAGGELNIGGAGRIEAQGGSAADNMGAGSGGQVAPGGGGSGGSLVLQCAGAADLQGVIDVRGGEGGLFDKTGGGGFAPGGGRIVIHGGDGSPGFVRFEQPIAPSTGDLAGMMPAATADNVGALLETDDLVSVRSRFYTAGAPCDIAWQSYELEATVDGVPMVFSDEPSISTMPAATGAPIRILLQAAQIDLPSGEITQLGPWRPSVASGAGQTGIEADGLNAYRFLLIVDRNLATDVRVSRLTVRIDS